MNITLIIIALLLFSLAFVTKRRWGLLGLALVAGSIISASWSSYVTTALQTQGIKLLSPPLNVVVAVCLIILPALILLFVGPKYHKKWQRVTGSLLFAALATLLIAIAIFREAPNLMADSQVGALATQAYPLIIVVGVIVAIVDTVMAHWPQKGRHSSD
jgi:hypothetical protein